MTSAVTSATPLTLLRDRFGIDSRSLEATLETALSRRVDYADLFFEYTTRDSVFLEEGIVKGGDRHLEQGLGVRAQAGERQGYAHSDEVTAKSALLAAATARAISEGPSSKRAVAVGGSGAPPRDLYPVRIPPTDVPIEAKTAVLSEIDAHARRADPRIQQVMASLIAEHRHILIAGSDGTLVADVRPLVRLSVQVIAEDERGRREVGYQGGGGRFDLARLLDPRGWKPIADDAVRLALLNLEAKPCPAGTMSVVLGPGWPGILLHEAIGHGLEGDFNRKKTSAFSGRIGERVAAEGVTVVDDGTIAERRGSLNVDDEGIATQRTVLIERGILRGYMHDRLSARLFGVPCTGNGRRESYAHLPMPRMTNTFMLAGEDEPEEIIRSVERGLYAVTFGGGQVDITSGKFVFSASEAYRIEGGELTSPVKGATLIGNGPDVLLRVSRIGCDLALDAGVGTCGKDGQSVPVGVGLPTIRIDDMTVGGTEG
jgi:TldD protein